MAQIFGQHGKPERQHCCADEQASKRNHYAFALLLSVEFSGQHRSFFRVRINGQVSQQFIEEGLTAETHRRSLRAIEPVDQFCEADGPEPTLIGAVGYRLWSLDEIEEVKVVKRAIYHKGGGRKKKRNR